MTIKPAYTLKVIPMPKSIVGEREDKTYALTNLRLGITCACDKFADACAAFVDYVRRLHGVTLAANAEGIALTCDDSLASNAYRITSTADGVTVAASSAEGANYALATLAQMVSSTSGGLCVPIATIDDAPDCSYRGLMVDLARQWHPFETLLKYVDLCWLYKTRQLHLHFIDSQSYTLPSDIFPKLPTEGRSYTKAQIAQLVDYAEKRGIELIPEIEVPGHAKAMVNAYPELFACVPLPEESERKIYDNIISVGKPGLMDTLRKLTAEIIEMFPNSKYLHIGGDEAAIDEWNHCAECTAYMKEHGIDGVKPLYTHFVKLMTDMVLDLGVTPIVWEGFPREGSEAISRDVIVIAWESYYHLAPDLLEEGFNIINCSWQPLYIVPSHHWTVENIMGWNIYNWQHWWPKSDARLNPIHVQPTEQVMGGQLCAWECTYEQEITPVCENLAALSERTWNIKRFADDSEFRAKLDYVLMLAAKLVK